MEIPSFEYYEDGVAFNWTINNLKDSIMKTLLTLFTCLILNLSYTQELNQIYPMERELISEVNGFELEGNSSFTINLNEPNLFHNDYFVIQIDIDIDGSNGTFKSDSFQDNSLGKIFSIAFLLPEQNNEYHKITLWEDLSIKTPELIRQPKRGLEKFDINKDFSIMVYGTYSIFHSISRNDELKPIKFPSLSFGLSQESTMVSTWLDGRIETIAHEGSLKPEPNKTKDCRLKIVTENLDRFKVKEIKVFNLELSKN